MQAESVIEKPAPVPEPDPSSESGKRARLDPFAPLDVSKNLRQSSVRGASFMSFARISGLVLRLGSTAILARLLAKEDFGVFGMTAVFSNFLAIFMDVGLSQATIQRQEISHRQISTLFWINVALSVVIALVFAVSAPLIAGFYKTPVLVSIIPVLALSYIFGGLGLQHSALLTRNMRYGLLAWSEIISSAAGVLVAVVMAKWGMGYWSLVGLALAPAVVKTAFLWMALRWMPSAPARGTGVRSMLKFGGDVLGFNVVNYFSRQAGSMLIGRYCGTAPLAAYDRAYSLLLMPLGQINGPLGSVSVPALSRLQNEPDRFGRYYLNAILLICSLSIPVIMGLTLFADQVVLLWLGREWMETAEIFRLLALATLIGGISNPAGWLLIALGQTKRYRTMGVVNSAVIVLAFVLGVFLGPKEAGMEGSVKGVAWAYSLAMLLNFIPYWAWSLKGTPVKLGQVMRTMMVPSVSCVPASLAAWAILHFSNSDVDTLAGGTLYAWLPVVGAGLAFGLIYAVMLLLVFKKLAFFRNIAGEFRSKR
ncbi:lipopolysaccharide biosynthesis protein [Luteolibacter sp. GHJ8]|uniref:Lipopolysaccharide biosynthesis protein n=1 Tax=Luteolibacter rhizosphaerae TaxID=2989719 RepID=A0ABT3G4P1_9BACT|nr:lipopolysaccharide biosynthesis protein [Luteolibacter rhizosphaerae]MCW1914797.1 lipopolysaccharide biosynthesis protein [Luteolibacter rhizosphaerae]